MPSKTTTRQPSSRAKPKPPKAAEPVPTPAAPPAPEQTTAPSESIVLEHPVAPLAPPVVAVEEPALASLSVPAPIVPEEPAPEHATAPVAPSEQEPVEETPATPSEVIKFGQVECLLQRMALGDVQLHLEAFGERIATLRTSQAVLDLQQRVLATEGRCAPIFFSADDDGEPEHLLSGIETIAAAMNLGLDCVFVVTVAPDDVGLMQAHIAASANQKPKKSDEDDFLLQVLARR